jgi:hypothetical protein
MFVYRYIVVGSRELIMGFDPLVGTSMQSAEAEDR